MFEIESSQQFKVFFFSKDQLDLFCGELRVAKTFFLEMDKYNELIEQRRSMGELDHPESTVINLKNVSHITSNLSKKIIQISMTTMIVVI